MVSRVSLGLLMRLVLKVLKVLKSQESLEQGLSHLSCPFTWQSQANASLICSIHTNTFTRSCTYGEHRFRPPRLKVPGDFLRLCQVSGTGGPEDSCNRQWLWSQLLRSHGSQTCNFKWIKGAKLVACNRKLFCLQVSFFAFLLAAGAFSLAVRLGGKLFCLQVKHLCSQLAKTASEN